MSSRRKARRAARVRTGDRTIFLQDVLSNALIAVLVLATVSMTQIAVGGMERHAGERHGPHHGIRGAGEERTLDDSRRETNLPRSTRTVWILADLPQEEVVVSKSAPTLDVAHWRSRDDGAGRHNELWLLDFSSTPVATESWTFEYAAGPLAGRTARLTILSDDRRLTSGSGPVTPNDPQTLLYVERSPNRLMRIRVP